MNEYPKLWLEIAEERLGGRDKHIDIDSLAKIGISMFNGCPSCGATISILNSWQISEDSPWAYCRDCANIPAKEDKNMAYIAIWTEYLGPTAYAGATIKATLLDRGRSDSYQVINPYDETLDTTWADGWNNHKKAAQELADWFYNTDVGVRLIGGWAKDGYVWVRFANNQVGEVI